MGFPHQKLDWFCIIFLLRLRKIRFLHFCCYVLFFLRSFYMAKLERFFFLVSSHHDCLALVRRGGVLSSRSVFSPLLDAGDHGVPQKDLGVHLEENSNLKKQNHTVIFLSNFWQKYYRKVLTFVSHSQIDHFHKKFIALLGSNKNWNFTKKICDVHLVLLVLPLLHLGLVPPLDAPHRHRLVDGGGGGAPLLLLL